jgi:hypothetical protein
MTEDDLFKLYERLYFHELERRERLSARLNVPLAVLVAAIGFLAFMLQSAPRDFNSWLALAFWLLFCSAAISCAAGMWFFRKAWFGHTDKLLPTANETETYRQELIKLYEAYDNAQKLVEAASENTINNDARSYNLYRATSSITVAVLLAFVAFIPFYANRV